MAISAYVGIPGSGKSYEVVKSVILPALANGRRVVSNIYGLNQEKINQYLLKKHKKLSENDLGILIHVENEACLKDNFLPSMENQDTFCQAGDLIIIDEVWRIWGSDKAIPANHRSFIAEHRHFADKETGVTCDLVVINQDVAQIPRFIKDRIETTYRMQKLTALGLTSRYKVEVFQGIKTFKSNRMSVYNAKYDKQVFPLYKSYEADNATEKSTDKRNSIFGSTFLWVLIIVLPLVFGYSIYRIYVFLQPSSHLDKSLLTNTTASATNTTDNTAISSTYSPVINEMPVILPLSTIWRISGELTKDGQAWVILVDNQNRIRLEPKSQFTFSGRMLQGHIDNQIVNYYSGGGQ